jgi:aspartate/methionine/tyrosine aminotransferase
MLEVGSFHVMSLLARARELEAQGRSIVHMEIGEPDFPTPRPIVEAGLRALEMGDIHYTSALGLSELRAAIADFYCHRYGIEISPRRVIVTPGASGALLLAMGVLLSPGDQVLMNDPGYPCYRNLARVMEGKPIAIPVGPESNYQLTPELIERHWTARTVAVMLASPSNPTGALIAGETLQTIIETVLARSGALIVDEIYHGLVYEASAPTALSFHDSAFVINSFSKYFGMTGWRLGWLIAPEPYLDDLNKLAQNIFLAPSTIAQRAALAAFRPETISVLEARRREFQARRDYLLPALAELGFEIPKTPEGAFYVYAGCRQLTSDSFRFADELLERTGVALTPGLDFGLHGAATHVRFAYTTSLPNLREGIERLRAHLKSG